MVDPPLRVWWVNQYAVPPDQPGGTRHFEMAGELGRLGIDARIVASDLNLTTRAYSRRRGPRSIAPVHEKIGDVSFTWLSAGSYAANDWRRVASMGVFALGVFAHLLTRRSPRKNSVVIGSSPHLFAALAAWAAAWVRRLPFVFEVRDLWPESYIEMTGKGGGIEIRIMRSIAHLLYRRADLVIVLAKPNEERVVAAGVDPWRVVTIPNGVDLGQFDEETGRVTIAVPGWFTFVYAGVHGPANGLEVVVDACALLAAEGDDTIRVVLVGDGPVKSSLIARARSAGLSNLTFYDPVPKDEVPALLRSADAGLMILAPVELFSYGVSPNKLFDYLAADLPVLTNVPGLVANIIEDADAGLEVPPGDPAALAAGMRRLAERFAAGPRPKGRAYVAEHFDRRKMAARLATDLRRVLQRSDGGRSVVVPT